MRELDDQPVDLCQDHIDRTAILDQLVITGTSTLANRPVSTSQNPGIEGRIWIVTDQPNSPRIDLDLGTSWVTIATATVDGAPNLATPRTLGTGANQACAGNDNRLAVPGDIKMTAVQNPPGGWIWCNGQVVSRSTYNALWNAIGTAYGAGDGSTTFAVPDLRSRVPVGAGAGPGLSARTNGNTGGEEQHVMSVAEMVSHAHGVADPGHAHSVYDPGHAHGVGDPGHTHYSWSDQNNSANVVIWTSGAQGNYFKTTGLGYTPIAGAYTGVYIGASGTGIGIYGAGTGIGIYNNGNGVPFNEMPPFGVVSYFIKT
jgi:microcystin-dependent protein